MRFLVPPCALVALLAAPAPAQPPGPQIQDGTYLLRLTASPAAPPAPALRYTLLPTARDTRPGNQIAAFYKCFMEQHRLFFDKDEAARREDWLTAPLAELKEEKDLVGYGGAAVLQARRAARLEVVDWQISGDLRADGIQLMLPDLQQLRELARVLRARARGEIARGEFDAAADTIQVHLALARTLNEHPTLIGSLVGIAIAATALSSVEEFVAQPGAPNLFWALADLPTPLFDLRKAAHGERVLITGDIAPLIDRVNPMTDAQIGRAVLKVTELLDLTTLKEGLAAPAPPAGGKADPPAPPPPPRPQPRPKAKTPATYLGDRAADAADVAAARAKLMPAAPTRDLRIEKFPPMQVILIDELNRYETARDDLLKWLSVPAWQLPPADDKLADHALLTPLAPAVLKVSVARTRVQQQVAMLQVVEALRAHAAGHGGRLPGGLDEVRLPLPNDPFTNRPFRYEVLNGVGVVRGTPPPDRRADATLNRVYEVEIRR
jgi:hypothetical protein